jgi:hypothetical protein
MANDLAACPYTECPNFAALRKDHDIVLDGVSRDIKGLQQELAVLAERVRLQTARANGALAVAERAAPRPAAPAQPTTKADVDRLSAIEAAMAALVADVHELMLLLRPKGRL